jgi:hypothetical protein
MLLLCFFFFWQGVPANLNLIPEKGGVIDDKLTHTEVKAAPRKMVHLPREVSTPRILNPTAPPWTHLPMRGQGYFSTEVSCPMP